MLTFPHFPSQNGDHIGKESCIDLENDKKFEFDGTGASSNHDCRRLEAKSRNSRINKNEKKEFPPPIPLLARTQNLPPHMPWVLKRYYTSDGRLILKEEKVHHEYFRVHRADGRLTLQLVSLDDVVSDTFPPNLDNHHDLSQEASTSSENNIDDHSLDSLFDDQHDNADDRSDSDMENKRALVGANSTAPPNPFNCNLVTSDSSRIFGVPCMQLARTVQT